MHPIEFCNFLWYCRKPILKYWLIFTVMMGLATGGAILFLLKVLP
ncbi:MAG: hypothetical protein WC769_01660 [Thermodesulfovibrionales bacterium]